MEELPKRNGEKLIGVIQNEINEEYSNLKIFLDGEAEPSSGDVKRAIELSEKIKKQGEGHLEDKLPEIDGFIKKNRDIA